MWPRGARHARLVLAHAIHPQAQRCAKTRDVEALRRAAPLRGRINRYSPPVPRLLEAVAGLDKLANATALAELMVYEAKGGGSH